MVNLLGWCDVLGVGGICYGGALYGCTAGRSVLNCGLVGGVGPLGYSIGMAVVVVVGG